MDRTKGMLPAAAAGHDDDPWRRLPVFAYGSLLDEEFLANLLGHPVPSDPAVLDGFTVETLAAFDWPVLVHADGGTVAGRLYRDLDGEDLRRLDAYEGVEEGLYVRVAVPVRTSSQAADEETAYVYLPTERTLTRGSRE